MARQQIREETQAAPEAPATPAVEVKEATGTMKDLFQRKIVGGSPVRQLKMRRTLTRPLRSMSQNKQLAVECTSEIFTMELPLKGRTGGLSATRVFEAKELIPTEAGFVDGEEVIVLCHEVMCSALERAGFKSLKVNPEEKALPEFLPVDGRSLVGALLGLIARDMEAGAKFRPISVAELE